MQELHLGVGKDDLSHTQEDLICPLNMSIVLDSFLTIAGSYP